MISSSFHKRYRIFLSSYPVLQAYLRWVYRTTDEDFVKLKVKPNLARVLLCGTSGEVTSSMFTEHVLAQRPDAKVTILDIGDAQIEHSKDALSRKFPDANIDYITADARKSGLPDASIDHIDTDFLFVYLDPQGLDELFAEWKRILAPGGTLSLRTFAVRSIFSAGAGSLMNLWCKVGLGSDAYSHTQEELDALFEKHGFEHHFAGRAFLPFGYRVVARAKG